MTIQGLLLDTCAIIYLAENQFRPSPANERILWAGANGNIFISPISAWEIGKIAASGKLAFSLPPLKYFHTYLNLSRAKLCEMSPEILVASSFLPGTIHKDPFDRILIETARHFDLCLVTSDRAILDYGEKGHVKTLAC